MELSSHWILIAIHHPARSSGLLNTWAFISKAGFCQLHPQGLATVFFWQSYNSLRTDKLHLKSKPGRLASIHLSPRIQHQELSEPSLCLFSPLQQPQKSARSDDKNRKNKECEAALRLFKPWTRTSSSLPLPMQQTLLTKSHLWLTDVSNVFSPTLLFWNISACEEICSSPLFSKTRNINSTKNLYNKDLMLPSLLNVSTPTPCISQGAPSCLPYLRT